MYIDDSTKEFLNSYLPEYVEMITEKSKGGHYNCPLAGCNSGKGRNHTGAFSVFKNGTAWNCFSCRKGGDIFKLVGYVEGIEGLNNQAQRIADIFGINLEADNTKKIEKRKKEIKAKPKPEPVLIDYSDYFVKANKNIGKTDYMTKRGISQETLDRFMIGYDENWNDFGRKSKTYPCIIFPNSKYSYNTRKTHMEPWDDIKNLKPAETKQHLFNEKALEEDKPVIIVEGEIDALSVMEVGGVAVGLGGTGNISKLKDKTPKKTLILAMDNDGPGQKTQQELKEDLDGAGIKYIEYNIAGPCNDANDYLLKDKAAFAETVKKAMICGEIGATEEEVDAYKKKSAGANIEDFVGGVADSVNTIFHSTGFKELDKVFDGGMYKGLYIISAISSLGKSTFALQIADHIAKCGQDVLIFALEMERTELMAKSISRLTCEIELAKPAKEQNVHNIKTCRGITSGWKYDKYSVKEVELIDAAIQQYGEYADHVYIIEGEGDIDVRKIRATVEKHVAITGNVPVVIVDYLQILAPYNERYTDQQNADQAIVHLKRISNEFKTPVVAISSIARNHYKEKASMASAKNSGGIEYGCDILIGLQFEGAGESGFDPDEAKRENPRKVEAIILKNRNGRSGDIIKYKYYPAFNRFQENGKKERA